MQGGTGVIALGAGGLLRSLQPPVDADCTKSPMRAALFMQAIGAPTIARGHYCMLASISGDVRACQILRLCTLPEIHCMPSLKAVRLHPYPGYEHL
jgi:hypothetical protein